MEGKLRKLNIVLLVFSLLAVGSGVTFSVLLEHIVHFIVKRIAGYSISTSLWMWGLTYIIPGVIGLVAVCARQRGVYVAHSVLSWVGVIVLIRLMISGSLSAADQSGDRGFCTETRYGCVCESQSMEALLKYFTCGEINRLVRMGISLDAMFWSGFVIIIISALISSGASHRIRKAEEEATKRRMSTNPGVPLYQLPNQPPQPQNDPPRVNPPVYQPQDNPPLYQLRETQFGYQPEETQSPHRDISYPIKPQQVGDDEEKLIGSPE